MGMTMTQKILADHADLDSVKEGQLIKTKLDMVLGNDITTPVAVKEFRRIGIDKVFDKARIAIVPDHFTPNKDIKSAEQVKFIRVFAKEMGIVNFFEVGQMGIEHALLPAALHCHAGDGAPLGRSDEELGPADGATEHSAGRAARGACSRNYRDRAAHRSRHQRV